MAYTSPGVTVVETVNPTVAPIAGNPAVVALVGAASGTQSASQAVTLPGTQAITLNNTGITTNTIVVKTYAGVTVGAGSYAVVQSSAGTSAIGDEVYTIARVASPSTAPTTASTAGALTGTYVYAVSYINAGGETGIGPASAPITLTAQGTSISAIPIGISGTTSRNIYRIRTDGDNIYHLVATIANNSATTLTDNVSDATASTGALPKGGIGDGDTVYVSYSYADLQYYQPTLMSNFGDVTNKYGQPYDTNGNILSPLSFAARLAYVNGASDVVCVAAKSSGQADIQSALQLLESDPTIRIVVVAEGSAGTLASVAAHCNTTISQGLYRIGVCGLDGTSTAITPASLRSSAQGINFQAIRLVSPTSFQMQNPVSPAASLNVGGQYMAAALAGMYAARDVQIPLTRKSIAGFTGINDIRTASDLVLDATAGLLAVKLLGGVLLVNHDITTAVGNVNTREASVVRAKYEMATRLKLTLDSGVVGLVAPTDRAILVVQSTIVGVLEQMVLEQAIQSYSDVAAVVANADPTTVQAQFMYVPAYPINNIIVQLAINTTSGEFTLQ